MGEAGKSCASRIDREAGRLQKHCVYMSSTFTALTLPEREVNSVFSLEQNISTPAMVTKSSELVCLFIESSVIFLLPDSLLPLSPPQ